jgi:hypothetical protein
MGELCVLQPLSGRHARVRVCKVEWISREQYYNTLAQQIQKMEMTTMSAASGIQITNSIVTQGCIPRNLTPWQTSSLLDLRRKPTTWSARYFDTRSNPNDKNTL